MIIHKFEQGTEEWLAIRVGKLTASNATAIASCWKWLDTYVLEIVSGMLSSWEKESFSNKHTERWHELEPQARAIYEMKKWVDVETVWFIEISDYIWCSPDWLIWDDWLIEIKCPDDDKYLKMLLNWESEIDSWYLNQMQMQMLLTDRKWCDFVAFNPNFKKSMCIYRILPNQDKMNNISKWLMHWTNEIKRLVEKFNSI